MFQTTTAFDLGLARRAAAALIALFLVTLVTTGWSYSDVPQVQSIDRV